MIVSISTLILLMALTCVDLWLFRSFVHPSVLFTAPFVVSVACGLMNYSAWEYDLHLTTAALLVSAAAVFTGAGFLAKGLTRARSLSGAMADGEGAARESCVRVPVAVAVLGLAFTVLVYAETYAHISKLVWQSGVEASGTGVLSAYDQLSKFGNVDVSIRGMAGHLFTAGSALSYVWLYLFVRNACARYWRGIVLIGANALLAAGLSLLGGGRAGLIQWTVAAFCLAMLMRPGGDGALPRKTLLRIALGLVVCLAAAIVLFRPFLALLGRTPGDQDIFAYISMYLGAPVKNLDMYLSGTLPNPITVAPRRWGDQSFALLYQSLAHWFGGESAIDWNSWQPYQQINGSSLGNVYTVFGPMTFDWGIVGSLIGIVVIALLVTVLYQLAHRSSQHKTLDIDVITMTYAYAAYGIAFCFYHNFIFTMTINTGFARYLMVWIACALAPMLFGRVKALLRGDL